MKTPTPVLRDELSSLGNILHWLCLVPLDGVRAALAVQRRQATPEPLGAILVQRGLCSEADIAHALAIQGRVRTADSAEAMLEVLEQGRSRLHAEVARAMRRPEPAAPETP